MVNAFARSNPDRRCPRRSDRTARQFVALFGERDSDRFAHAEMDVDAAKPNRVRPFVIYLIATPQQFRRARDRGRRHRRASVRDRRSGGRGPLLRRGTLLDRVRAVGGGPAEPVPVNPTGAPAPTNPPAAPAPNPVP